MKKFEVPKMLVVRLNGEDVIVTSLCTGVTCPKYICPDCVSCTNTFECLSLKCDFYEN